MHETDQEQIEAIKSWWDQYGNAVIGGFLVFIAVFFGNRFWENYQTTQREEASSAYFELIQGSIKAEPSQQDLAALQADVEVFSEQYTKGSYAVFAQMWLAQQATVAGDLALAEDTLARALSANEDEAMKGVIGLRLARIQLDQKKYEAVQATLDQLNESEYESAVTELKGDLAFAQGDDLAAATLYQQALDALPEGLSKPVLSLKAEMLGNQ